MNIQQLQYIVSLNKLRHFANAAKECGVSQPTLSTMIGKMEDELDVKIFDRDKSPVSPTKLGSKLIKQAETILNDISRLNEIVLSEKNTLKGMVKIGILPTIAPYFVPSFITKFQNKYEDVNLNISDMDAEKLKEDLFSSKLDMAIIATPLYEKELLEIPLYNERYFAYFSEQNGDLNKEKINPLHMPTEKLWVLTESPCLKSELVDFCKMRTSGQTHYHTGSVETLIRIVDESGGYTIIPELNSNLLSQKQKKGLRLFDTTDAQREISIVIRKDYVKEKMLNAVIDVVKEIIPDEMLKEKIKKYSIRL